MSGDSNHIKKTESRKIEYCDSGQSLFKIEELFQGSSKCSHWVKNTRKWRKRLLIEKKNSLGGDNESHKAG